MNKKNNYTNRLNFFWLLLMIFTFSLSFKALGIHEKCSSNNHKYWIFLKKAAPGKVIASVRGLDKIRLFVIKNGYLNWCDIEREIYIASHDLKKIVPTGIQLGEGKVNIFKKNETQINIELLYPSRGRKVLSLFVCNKDGCASKEQAEEFTIELQKQVKEAIGLKKAQTAKEEAAVLIMQKALKTSQLRKAHNKWKEQIDLILEQQLEKNCPCLDTCKKSWTSLLPRGKTKYYCPVTKTRVNLNPFTTTQKPEGECGKYSKYLQHTRGNRWYRLCKPKKK